MRCDFCGEEIEGQPFYKDGMSFCSLECSDAMEGGETMPLDEDVLDDPEDYTDESFEEVDEIAGPEITPDEVEDEEDEEGDDEEEDDYDNGFDDEDMFDETRDY